MELFLVSGRKLFTGMLCLSVALLLQSAVCAGKRKWDHTRAAAAHFVTSQSSVRALSCGRCGLCIIMSRLRVHIVNMPGCLTLFRVVSLCCWIKGIVAGERTDCG